ncbi:MAG: right-handed parallel beta-helix repeat-containing protein [Oscillospiraceae bacterium]|nr:right-handed parallel beta-helix repeat-containing protein [Oscillospiraceae bacterium]
MKKVICIIISIGLMGVGFVGCNKKTETPHSIMAEIYVSSLGDDNNNGTKDSPFLTIEKAQSEVRKINQDMNGDIIVYLDDGTYVLDDTLVFDERDSATNDFDIIYTAADGAKPVISGGSEIGGFTLFDEETNIYSAKVEDGFTFRQLYVNGEKAVRARSNTDYSTRILGASRFGAYGNLIPENLNYDGEDALVPADYGEIYINANEFGEFKNLEKVELHVLTAWIENILRIKSAQTVDNQVVIRIQDNENKLIFNRMHPNIDGYSYKSTHDFVYYLENAYELIDTDNEWYLDESTNTLYFKAPSGLDMNSAAVIAPRLETLVSVNTNDNSKINNLTFDGITFEYSTWNYPSENGLVELQAGMYANYCIFGTNDCGALRPAAGIYVANTHNFTMKNCTVQNMGAAGIDLNYGTYNSLIQDNTVQNISGNGIMIGKFVVDENTDFHVAYNPENEDEICTNDKIVNNYVHHIGTDYEGSVAIGAGYPKNILIANNEVAYAPYTGISVGFGWTSDDNAMSGNRILNNHIHHTSQILCDAGGIYTLSKQPNSEMIGNYIHDITTPAWADYDTCGIYMDEQTGGYTVKNNVLENAPIIWRNQNGKNNYKEKSIYIDANRIGKIQKIIDNAGVRDDFDISQYE